MTIAPLGMLCLVSSQLATTPPPGSVNWIDRVPFGRLAMTLAFWVRLEMFSTRMTWRALLVLVAICERRALL